MVSKLKTPEFDELLANVLGGMAVCPIGLEKLNGQKPKTEQDQEENAEQKPHGNEKF